jgi:hypothetical protein
MKANSLFKSVILLSILTAWSLTKLENRSLRLAKTSKEKIKELEEQLEKIQEAQRTLKDKNVKRQIKASEIVPKDESGPTERRLEDEPSQVTNTISHSVMQPFGGMMTPSLLPPPPPIFSTGKLPVTTQYHIVHYPSHVNTPWNLLSYPRVMAPHYGYMGYPLHPYNYMHMAHAAHTAMLGAHMGMPGAFANPYIYSPYSMGLHPFGYLPPVGMPYMPHSSYGLGGFSSPFPYGVYGSFGYDSSMMNGRKKKKARKLSLKKEHLV